MNAASVITERAHQLHTHGRCRLLQEESVRVLRDQDTSGARGSSAVGDAAA